MRILLAEDDPTTREILRKAVTMTGHVCETALDGEEAWARLQNDPVPFDAVISSWQMPGMNGPDLCRLVRTSTERYISFLLVTARNHKQDLIEGMQAGVDDYLTKPLNLAELRLRLISVERLSQLHRRLERQTAELRKLNALFYAQGRQDKLTGIANRLQMEEDLAQRHQQAIDLNGGYSVALIDIDHFKWYNDGFGHPAGDATLRSVAQVLANNVRGTDKVYRYGGEEFCVVLSATEPTQAMAALERMRAAVQARAIPHVPEHEPGVVTISVGVVTVQPAATTKVEDVLKWADIGLYRAKEHGRNQVAEGEVPAEEGSHVAA